MEKKRQVEFFMTLNDELNFCKAVLEQLPNCYFFDVGASKDADIEKRLFSSVTDSSSMFFSIVNFDFISKITLAKQYKKYDEYYHFSQTGKAQIQFLRSKPDSFNLENLSNGRLADSYNSEDEEEKKWKNIVYNLIKKMGGKVFWYYTTPNGKPEIKTNPENGLFALPNALIEYDGKNGFMTHGTAKFVREGIRIEDIIV